MSYRSDISYKRYANYRANRHQYKMNQIAAPIAMILIIGFVSKFWWILLGVGIVVLFSILFRFRSDREAELEKCQRIYYRRNYQKSANREERSDGT